MTDPEDRPCRAVEAVGLQGISPGNGGQLSLLYYE